MTTREKVFYSVMVIVSFFFGEMGGRELWAPAANENSYFRCDDFACSSKVDLAN